MRERERERERDPVQIKYSMCILLANESLYWISTGLRLINIGKKTKVCLPEDGLAMGESPEVDGDMISIAVTG